MSGLKLKKIKKYKKLKTIPLLGTKRVFDK